MSKLHKRIEELEAKLAKVTAERDDLKAERDQSDAFNKELRTIVGIRKDRAETAEVANLRFYRAGVEDAAVMALGSGRQGMYSKTFRKIASAIRALPAPTPEQIDAIRKGSE